MAGGEITPKHWYGKAGETEEEYLHRLRTANRKRIRNPSSAYSIAKRLRDAIKSLHPCADCGLWFEPHILDFDHVRGVKLGNVSAFVGRGDWRGMLKEAEKCDIVCANCHRERTHGRKQFGAKVMVDGNEHLLLVSC